MNLIKTTILGAAVDVVNINGDFYLKSEAIGKALGYEKPRKSILKIYERNRDLLGEYSTAVNMTSTDDIQRQQRVFNTEGVMLVCMKSQQPKAIAFQKEAVKVLKSLLKGENQTQIPKNFSEALRLAAELEEEKAKLHAQIEINKPKVEFAEKVSNAINSVTVGDFAKALGTGQNRLFKLLRSKSYLMRDNRPYQRYIDKGIFKLSEKAYQNMHTGEDVVYMQTLITGKGQAYLAEQLKEHLPQAATLEHNGGTYNVH